MSRSISRVVLFCGLLLLAIAAEGCQRGPEWNLALVEGTVTKGGRPLANIEVVFLPDAGMQGPRARGITDEAGHYRLRTDNGDDGTVVGKHRVVLSDPEVALKQLLRDSGGKRREKAEQLLPGEDAKRLENQRKLSANAPRLPPRYERFSETPLHVEVQPGLQVIDFEVK
jgi:hypothetical protein